MKLFFALVFFWIFCPKVYADSPKFEVTTNVVYKIEETGNTIITQNFNLTNLTSDYAPETYTTRLGLKEIHNFKAYGPMGLLKVEMKDLNNDKEIQVDLEDQTIGLGRTLSWTVIYETNEVAKKVEQMWEINIPRPADIEGMRDFSIDLYLPASFGKKVFMKPSAANLNYHWSKTDLKTNGIYAVFDSSNRIDSYKVLDFSLNYQLRNSKLYPVNMEIPLPADNSYQKVYVKNIDPKPVSVTLDSEGNWKARFQLGVANQINVRVQGTALIYYQPKFPPTTITSTQGNLQTKTNWETDDPGIKLVASRLRSPEQIYQFVISTLALSTKTGPVKRLGAKASLSSPNEASALEFADLFIALCRSSGVPARITTGFYKGNFSVWPEYFDLNNRSWVPVDPMLGKLTGGLDYFNSWDLNHLTLAVNGQDGKLFPAETIQAEFAPRENLDDISDLPHVGLRADIPPRVTAGFGSEATVFVENYGPGLFPGGIVNLSASDLTVSPMALQTGPMPPFSKQALKFYLTPSDFLQDQSDIITVKFDQETRTFQTQIKPFFRNNFILTISILFSLGILSLIAQVARSLFFQRQKG